MSMARVLVVGSSNTDLTVRLPKLPTPGQTALGGALLIGPGGKGANQAVAAARAGADVVFVSAVGDDQFGHQALEHYRREGIDVSCVRTFPDVASGVALIFVANDGENMIGVAPGANALLRPEEIDKLPDALFARDGVLLIAGLEVPHDTVTRAVQRGGRNGMKTVLNPAPVPADLLDTEVLQAVDVITPNRVELGQLTGIDTARPENVPNAARKLLDKGPGCVVVTLGAEGCLFVNRHSEVITRSHRVDVVDTVGAGDAFSAALAVALSEGRSAADAATWANAAAALAVTAPGAQSALPYREQINRLASGRTNKH
jgi:ribokinase